MSSTMNQHVFYICAFIVYIIAGSRMFKYLTLTLKSRPGHVLVSWDIEDEYMGRSIKYKLYREYERASECDSLNDTDREEIPLNSPLVRSYELTEVKAWTTLIVTLEGQDNGSSSEDSIVAKIKTHETAPTGSATNIRADSINENSAQLSWDPPACSDRGGVLGKYIVQITPLGAPGRALNLTSTTESLLVPNLEPFTQYEVKVIYTNAQGQGPFSNPFTFTTREGPPSAPLIYNYTVDDVTIGIIIMQPLKPNGQIEQYQVELTGASVGVSNLYTPVNGTEYVIGRLQPNTTYTIRARARNTAGWGAWSNFLYVVTQPEVWPILQDLRQTLANFTCVGFTWARPPGDFGTVSHYKVTVSSKDENRRRFDAVVDKSIHDFIQCNLSPHKEHVVTVSVMRGTGQLGQPMGAHMWTEGLVPPKPRPPTIRKVTDKTVTIEIYPVVFNQGPITSYEIRLLEIQNNHTEKIPHDIDTVLGLEFPGSNEPVTNNQHVNTGKDPTIWPTGNQSPQPTSNLKEETPMSDHQNTPNIRAVRKRSTRLELDRGKQTRRMASLNTNTIGHHQFIIKAVPGHLDKHDSLSILCHILEHHWLRQSRDTSSNSRSTHVIVNTTGYIPHPNRPNNHRTFGDCKRSDVFVSQNGPHILAPNTDQSRKYKALFFTPISKLFSHFHFKGIDTFRTSTVGAEGGSGNVFLKKRGRRALGNPPGSLWLELPATDVTQPMEVTIGDDKLYQGKTNQPLKPETEYAIFLVVKSSVVDVTKHAYSFAPTTVVTLKSEQESEDLTSEFSWFWLLLLLIFVLLFFIFGFFVLRYLVSSRRDEKQESPSEDDNERKEEARDNQEDYDAKSEESEVYDDYDKLSPAGDAAGPYPRKNDELEAYFNPIQTLGERRYINTMRDNIMYYDSYKPLDASRNNASSILLYNPRDTDGNNSAINITPSNDIITTNRNNTDSSRKSFDADVPFEHLTIPSPSLSHPDNDNSGCHNNYCFDSCTTVSQNDSTDRIIDKFPGAITLEMVHNHAEATATWDSTPRNTVLSHIDYVTTTTSVSNKESTSAIAPSHQASRNDDSRCRPEQVEDTTPLSSPGSWFESTVSLNISQESDTSSNLHSRLSSKMCHSSAASRTKKCFADDRNIFQIGPETINDINNSNIFDRKSSLSSNGSSRSSEPSTDTRLQSYKSNFSRVKRLGGQGKKRCGNQQHIEKHVTSTGGGESEGCSDFRTKVTQARLLKVDSLGMTIRDSLSSEQLTSRTCTSFTPRNIAISGRSCQIVEKTASTTQNVEIDQFHSSFTSQIAPINEFNSRPITQNVEIKEFHSSRTTQINEITQNNTSFSVNSRPKSAANNQFLVKFDDVPSVDTKFPVTSGNTGSKINDKTLTITIGQYRNANNKDSVEPRYCRPQSEVDCDVTQLLVTTGSRNVGRDSLPSNADLCERNWCCRTKSFTNYNNDHFIPDLQPRSFPNLLDEDFEVIALEDFPVEHPTCSCGALPLSACSFADRCSPHSLQKCTKSHSNSSGMPIHSNGLTASNNTTMARSICTITQPETSDKEHSLVIKDTNLTSLGDISLFVRKPPDTITASHKEYHNTQVTMHSSQQAQNNSNVFYNSETSAQKTDDSDKFCSERPERHCFLETKVDGGVGCNNLDEGGDYSCCCVHDNLRGGEVCELYPGAKLTTDTWETVYTNKNNNKNNEDNFCYENGEDIFSGFSDDDDDVDDDVDDDDDDVNDGGDNDGEQEDEEVLSADENGDGKEDDDKTTDGDIQIDDNKGVFLNSNNCDNDSNDTSGDFNNSISNPVREQCQQYDDSKNRKFQPTRDQKKEDKSDRAGTLGEEAATTWSCRVTKASHANKRASPETLLDSHNVQESRSSIKNGCSQEFEKSASKLNIPNNSFGQDFDRNREVYTSTSEFHRNSDMSGRKSVTFSLGHEMASRTANSPAFWHRANSSAANSPFSISSESFPDFSGVHKAGQIGKLVLEGANNDRRSTTGKDRESNLRQHNTMPLNSENTCSLSLSGRELGVVGDRELDVVGGAKELDVGGARELDVGVARELDVGVARELHVGGARELDVGGARELDVGVARELDVGVARELDVARKAPHKKRWPSFLRFKKSPSSQGTIGDKSGNQMVKAVGTAVQDMEDMGQAWEYVKVIPSLKEDVLSLLSGGTRRRSLMSMFVSEADQNENKPIGWKRSSAEGASSSRPFSSGRTGGKNTPRGGSAAGYRRDRGGDRPVSFMDEFKALEQYKEHLIKSLRFDTALRHPERNRYRNILPPEHTRVHLDTTRPGDIDYYNASYLDIRSDIQYIAAQSPFSTLTVEVFWQMVLQNRVETIVMMSKCRKDGTVMGVQYWVDSGVFAGGPVLVEMLDHQKYSDFAIRTLKVSAFNFPQVTVTHFQFQTWPLSGVPDDAIPLLELRYRVRRSHGNKDTPILVHCDTGAAQSAIYISADLLIEQYGRDGSVNVYGFTKRLCQSRPAMIRSLRQYRFIYATLLEEFQAGDTVLRFDLEDKFKALCSRNPQTGFSFLMDEFRMLITFTPDIDPNACGAALLPENVSKNVDGKILPPEVYRPTVNVQGDPSTRGYINAVFVNSLRRQREFLVTQTPRNNTVHVFWRMVYDYQVQAIVQLGTCDGPNQAQYIPSKGPRRFEQLLLEHVNVVRLGSVTVRNLTMSLDDAKGVERRAIRHFQVAQWMNEEVMTSSKKLEIFLNSPNDVIDLIGNVMDWQMISNRRTKPVVVCCSDGATSCGIFCACAVLCDRLREDHEVDLYHTVKHMKRRRPQFIADFDQYRFLYLVLLEYIKSHLMNMGDVLDGGEVELSSQDESDPEVHAQDFGVQTEASLFFVDEQEMKSRYLYNLGRDLRNRDSPCVDLKEIHRQREGRYGFTGCGERFDADRYGLSRRYAAPLVHDGPSPYNCYDRNMDACQDDVDDGNSWHCSYSFDRPKTPILSGERLSYDRRNYPRSQRDYFRAVTCGPTGETLSRRQRFLEGRSACYRDTTDINDLDSLPLPRSRTFARQPRSQDGQQVRFQENDSSQRNRPENIWKLNPSAALRREHKEEGQYREDLEQERFERRRETRQNCEGLSRELQECTPRSTRRQMCEGLSRELQECTPRSTRRQMCEGLSRELQECTPRSTRRQMCEGLSRELQECTPRSTRGQVCEGLSRELQECTPRSTRGQVCEGLSRELQECTPRSTRGQMCEGLSRHTGRMKEKTYKRTYRQNERFVLVC